MKIIFNSCFNYESNHVLCWCTYRINNYLKLAGMIHHRWHWNIWPSLRLISLRYLHPFTLADPHVVCTLARCNIDWFEWSAGQVRRSSCDGGGHHLWLCNTPRLVVVNDPILHFLTAPFYMLSWNIYGRAYVLCKRLGRFINMRPRGGIFQNSAFSAFMMKK